MGLQIRGDLFTVDHKTLGGKSTNIVDNMQRMLLQKKTKDLELKQVFQEKKEHQVAEKLNSVGKMEALKRRRAEKRAAAVAEFWQAVLRERKMKEEREAAKMEVDKMEAAKMEVDKMEVAKMEVDKMEEAEVVSEEMDLMDEETEQERRERKEMRQREWEEKEKELEEMSKRRKAEERQVAQRKTVFEEEVIDILDEEEALVKEESQGWFNARAILLEMNQGQARITEIESPKSESPNNISSPDLEASQKNILENEKFSDHLGDAVKVKCQLCQSCESLTAMRSHTRKMHDMSIAEYRKRFGDLADHLVEMVHHKCKLCDKVLLLDADRIHHHARTHGVSLKTYTATYMTHKNRRKY